MGRQARKAKKKGRSIAERVVAALGRARATGIELQSLRQLGDVGTGHSGASLVTNDVRVRSAALQRAGGARRARRFRYHRRVAPARAGRGRETHAGAAGTRADARARDVNGPVARCQLDVVPS